MEPRNCSICGTSFKPNKYSPRQRVCPKPECQRARQIQSMKEWRQKHPTYFKYDESKGQDWLRMQRERSRNWRRNNPDKIKFYRQAHLEEYRQYMRDYMRKYRQKRKGPGSDEPSSSSTPPPTPPSPNLS